MSLNKVSFPDSVQEALTKFTSVVIDEGFFNDPLEFPPNYIEQGKTNLWNIAGEELLNKFIEGSKDFSLNEDEVNKILVNTLVQTNLDSLMDDKLIDGIENEHGEMIYWMTEKGKEIQKNLGKDC